MKDPYTKKGVIHKLCHEIFLHDRWQHKQRKTKYFQNGKQSIFKMENKIMANLTFIYNKFKVQ